MRKGLLPLGIIAILIGLVWIGQGTGAFPYPQSSFMIGETIWLYNGIVLTSGGLIALWLSLRPR